MQYSAVVIILFSVSYTICCVISNLNHRFKQEKWSSHQEKIKYLMKKVFHTVDVKEPLTELRKRSINIITLLYVILKLKVWVKIIIQSPRNKKQFFKIFVFFTFRTYNYKKEKTINLLHSNLSNMLSNTIYIIYKL